MGLGLQHTPPLPSVCQALSSSSSFLAVFNLGKLFVVWIQTTFHWHPWTATLPCLTLARISPGTHRHKTHVQIEQICQLQGFIPQVPSLNQAGKAKRSLSSSRGSVWLLETSCLGICSLQTKAPAWRACWGEGLYC